MSTYTINIKTSILLLLCFTPWTPALEYESIRFDNAPSEQSFIMHADALILCDVSGNPAPSVSWRRQGRRIQSDDKFSQRTNGLHIKEISKDDAGIYTCRAEQSEYGVFKQKDINIIVGNPEMVKIDNAPSEQSFITHADALILCEVSGNPAPSVSWRHQGLRIQSGDKLSQQSNGIKIKDISVEDAGPYTCRAEQPDYGTFQQRNINVIVGNPVEVNFENAPSEQIFNAQSDALVLCQVSGYPSPQVTWRRNGRTILNDDKYVKSTGGLYINSISEEDAGIYSCQAEQMTFGIYKRQDINVIVRN